MQRQAPDVQYNKIWSIPSDVVNDCCNLPSEVQWLVVIIIQRTFWWWLRNSNKTCTACKRSWCLLAIGCTVCVWLWKVDGTWSWITNLNTASTDTCQKSSEAFKWKMTLDPHHPGTMWSIFRATELQYDNMCVHGTVHLQKPVKRWIIAKEQNNLKFWAIQNTLDLVVGQAILT